LILRLILALAALLLPTALYAHTGTTGPHGGTTVDAGPYYFELITQADQLKIYVFNDATEKPESMKTARGTATVLLGQQREIDTLQPDASEPEGHLLTGKLGLAPGPGMRIVVQLQVPGQPSVVARFAL
jgi:hypothetical protein